MALKTVIRRIRQARGSIWIRRIIDEGIRLGDFDRREVRYEAICSAIAECHRVDEMKETRDRLLHFRCTPSKP